MPEVFEADLAGALFWGADLSGARFRDLNLTNARISPPGWSTSTLGHPEGLAELLGGYAQTLVG